MTRLVLDLETTSTADLRKTGSHAYAEHPDTRVTVLCYAIDDGPVERWLAGPPPATFVDAVSRGATVVAHNYLFEHNIYFNKLVPQGWPVIPLSQWSCTMARALVAGYPASLDLVGRALGLSQQKDHASRDLMLRFARPRSLEPVTWWHETDPVRFKALQDYCAQDVMAERELDRRVPELSPRERQVFELDHAINQRGIGVDHLLVAELARVTGAAQTQLQGDIVRLTNGQVRTLNQVAQLRSWLAFQGVDAPDLRRATVQTLLADQTLTGAPRIALQARLDASRSSTAKLTAIASARSHDGRLRGTFQYYGASRTGRWAGRRLQPQNLFRGSIKDVAGALRAIHAGAAPEDLDLLFEDSALGVVASCLRSTITAGPLHRLAIADFSQIEARVLAWLAGQQDALQVFRRGEDIYIAAAKGIGSDNRTLGKVLTLACIAEGEPVLTDRGLIPIEQVSKDMRLWDGLEWVSHDGVVCRGEREIIEYDGLRATPDHLVWAEGSGDPVPFGDAASALDRLIRASTSGIPLRVLGGAGPDLHRRSSTQAPALSMHGVWEGTVGRLEQLAVWQNQRMSMPVSTEHGPLPGTLDAQGHAQVGRGQSSLPEPQQPAVGRLWWPRDYFRLLEPARRDGVGHPASWGASTQAGTGPDQQRQGLRPGQPSMGDPERAECQQTAKVYDILNAGPRHRFTVSDRLAHNCGFAMGHLKFQATALIYGLILDEAEAEAAVRAWREVNHHIVTLWWESHRALLRVLRAGPGAEERVGYLTFIHRPGALLARLPSGRHLVYRHPQIQPNEHGYDEITYMGSLGGNWTRLRAWAGRTIENVTQAVARDVMVEAMLQLRDLPIIATIHDELIAEIPEAAADQVLDQMLTAMRRTPLWAPGLPVDAAGFVVRRYTKG